MVGCFTLQEARIVMDGEKAKHEHDLQTCPKCRHDFHDSEQLQVHAQLHHGHQCDDESDCGLSFVHLFNLQNHQFLVHGSRGPPDISSASLLKEEVDQLENSLDDNLKEAEFLAMETINVSRVPLVSSRFTKLQLESAIKESRKLLLVDQISCLSLMTDQIVSLLDSPGLAFTVITDIGLGKLLQMVCKEWNKIFEKISRNYSSSKLSNLFMRNLLTFLQGQYKALQRLANKTLSSNMLYTIDKQKFSRDAFWKFNLESIDGKPCPKNPVSNLAVSSMSTNSLVTSKAAIKPKSALPDSSDSPQSTSCGAGQDSPATLPTPTLRGPHNTGVSKKSAKNIPLHSFQLESFYLQQSPLPKHLGNFTLEVFSKGLAIVNDGVSLYLDFDDRELSRAIFSPETTPQSLYLFLEPRGAIKVMTISQGIKEIPKSVCSSFCAAKDRKMVLKFPTPLTASQREDLRKSFEKDLGLEWVAVRPTFARFLDLGLVDPGKAFTDSSVRISSTDWEDSSSDEGDRDDEDDLHYNVAKDIIDTLVHETLKQSMRNEAFNISELILEEVLESIVAHFDDGDEMPLSGHDESESFHTVSRKRKVSDCDHGATDLTEELGPSKSTSLPSPDINRNFPEPLLRASTWHPSQAGGLDIPLMVSNNEQEFYEMNRSLLEQQFPDIQVFHEKILHLKWKELIAIMDSAEECQPPERKKPRIFVSKNIFESCKESSGVAEEKKLNENVLETPAALIATAPDDEKRISMERASLKNLKNTDKTKGNAMELPLVYDEQNTSSSSSVKVLVSLKDYKERLKESSEVAEENVFEKPAALNATEKVSIKRVSLKKMKKNDKANENGMDEPLVHDEKNPSSRLKARVSLKDYKERLKRMDTKSKMDSHEVSTNVAKPKETRKEVKDCIDLTKEDSVDDKGKKSNGNSCSCDDCVYMTKSHKKRMLKGKFKCSCHPCKLRKELLLTRRTDPYQVVKLQDYKEKGDYWTQSWVGDLYVDMYDGKIDLQSAMNLTGSKLIETKFKKYKLQRDLAEVK